MIDVMNTFIAIILSVVALTPIFLLVVLLNKQNAPAAASLDPSVIKRLEDMDTTIATDTNIALETVSAKLEDLELRLADLEDQRTTISGFKGKK